MLRSEALLRRVVDRARSVWLAAKTERASPREIFWAVFVGVFAGCTPAIGFHGPLALGLATLFRKNRLFAWLGSRIANMMMLPFIAMAEVQISHRIRTGAWVAFTRDRIFEQARELVLDWCLGTIPVGATLGAFIGFGAYAWAARRAARVTIAAAEPPRPSSGSPA